jgi:hypothetical protein
MKRPKLCVGVTKGASERFTRRGARFGTAVLAYTRTCTIRRELASTVRVRHGIVLTLSRNGEIALPSRIA